MIGRLQTEQDKARLVDGLTSAAGSVDPRAVGDTISGLGKREFVMKRASKDTVSVFTTRWAMSYLRGPLTREQIASLQGRLSGSAGARCPGTGPRPSRRWPPHAPAAPPAPPTPAPPTATARLPGARCAGVTTGARPRQPRRPAPWRPTRPRSSRRPPRASPCTSWTPPPRGQRPSGAVPGHRLTPGAIARVLLRFDDARAGIVLDQEYEAILTPLSPFPTATQFRAVDYDDRDLLPTPPPGAVYRIPPTEVGAKTWWTDAPARPRRPPPALHDRGGPDQRRAEALRADRGDRRGLRRPVPGRRRGRRRQGDRRPPVEVPDQARRGPAQDRGREQHPGTPARGARRVRSPRMRWACSAGCSGGARPR